MITKNSMGFTEIELETGNMAVLSGFLDESEGAFVVADVELEYLKDSDEFQWFDRKAAEEAAAFFTEIANELKRRGF